MVGGSNFPEAKELLDHMGKNIVHCGAVGTGQVRMSYLSYSPQGYRFSHFNSILFFFYQKLCASFLPQCKYTQLIIDNLLTSSFDITFIIGQNFRIRIDDIKFYIYIKFSICLFLLSFLSFFV